jgi:hypothetical protein
MQTSIRWLIVACVSILWLVSIQPVALAATAYDDTALVDDDGTPIGNRTPLILVHGIHGNKPDGGSDDIAHPYAGYFGNFIHYFYTQAPATYNPGVLNTKFKIYRFHYVSDQHFIPDIAQAFKQRIDAYPGGFPNNFVVLAHSMGGLVARSYMSEQSGGSRVIELITLATPHHGTPMANEGARAAITTTLWETLMDIGDGIEWGNWNPLAAPATHAGDPNRADLRWDNYDGVMKSGYNNALETNSWLRNLNNVPTGGTTVYGDRIIAYYGYLSEDDTKNALNGRSALREDVIYDLLFPGGSLTASSALLSYAGVDVTVPASKYHHQLVVVNLIMGLGLTDSHFTSNDGLVSIDSAAFLQNGHAVPRALRSFEGYDHQEMRDGKASEPNKLFDQVAVDLIAAIPPTTTTIQISSITPSSFISPTPSQPLVITGSGFTAASTLLFNSLPSLNGITFDSSTQIRYSPTLAAGSYTVKVVNGAVTSNGWPITVVPPPSPSTGAISVAILPAAAVTAGAQWQVNGTYHNSGDSVSGLAPGTYTVSFKSIAGYSAPVNQSVSILANQTTSATGTYSANAPSIVSTPSILPGSGTYIGNQQVTITSGTTGATIYFTTNGTTPGSGIGSQLANGGSFTLTETADVRAIATKSGLTNSQIAIASITINSPSKAANPSPSDGATNVSQTAPLSWTAGGSASSFDVYFGTSNPPPFVQNQIGMTYNPGALSTSHRYYWQINVKNNTETIQGDVWQFVTILSGIYPSAPTNPSPAHGAGNVPNNTILSWSSGGNTISYDIYFGTTYPPPFIVNQTNTTYNPGLLNYNTTYYWRVNAKNATGTSNGGSWEFFTGAPLPGDAVANSYPPVIQGSAKAIAVDGDGNRYVVGDFYGTAQFDFNPGIGVDAKACLASRDVFITRFNADGSYAWTQTFGGITADTGPESNGITVSGTTVYVTGSFSSLHAGIGGTVSIDCSGGRNVFVLALNASTGAAVSSFGFGGVQKFGGGQYDNGCGIAVSGSTVYVSGYFTSTDAGIGGTGSIAPTGSTGAFVIALDASTGAAKSNFGSGGVQKFGGTSYAHGQGIAVLGTNVYLTGDFAGASAGVGGTGSIASSGSQNAFVLALNATTGAAVSSFGVGGVQKFGGTGGDGGNGIAASGNTLYVTGGFASTNAGVGGTGSIASLGSGDAFVLALNATTGAAVSGFGVGGVQKFGGTGSEAGTSIVTSGTNVYVAGWLSSANAGIGGIGTIAAAGYQDACIFALDANTGAAISTFGKGGVQTFGGSGNNSEYATGIAAHGTSVYTTGIFASTDAGIGGTGSYDSTIFGAFLLPLKATDGTFGAKVQTISFGSLPDVTYGLAPFAMTATATSGLPIVYTIISGPATVSGNVLILTGAGTVTVQAGQPGNAVFKAALSVEHSFNVAKADQAITFAALPDKSVSDLPFAITATANSGLTVNLNVVSGPAVLNGNILTLVGSGIVAISAFQPGSSNYNAALTLQRSFTVTGVPQSIAFGPLSQQTIGDAPFPVSASASSGLPVAFTIVSGPATLDGNIIMVTGAGMVTVQASQIGNDYYSAAPNVTQSFLVRAANIAQTITFDPILDKVFGDAPVVLNASASSGLPLSFLISGPATLTGSTLTITGTGTVSITASQIGDLNYVAAADVTQSFIVNKAEQTIVFSPISDRASNALPFAVNATASSGLPVSLTIVSGPASLNGSTITLTGAGTVTVRAMQEGDSNYLPATPIDQSFKVSDPQPPAFVSGPFGVPNPVTVGQTVQFIANATNNLPVTYIWDFNDQTSGNGSSVSHTFTSAKAYAVTVTAINTANLSTTATVIIQVNAATSGVAVLPGEVDSDGDGYSDAVEVMLGTSPMDFTDSPTHGAAPVVQTLMTSSPKITKKRVLTLKGAFSIPGGFTASGKLLVADLGGFTQKFNLSAKGSGKTGKDTFSLIIKSKKGIVAAQQAKFALKLNNVPETVTTGSPVQFIVGGIIFTAQSH